MVSLEWWSGRNGTNVALDTLPSTATYTRVRVTVSFFVCLECVLCACVSTIVQRARFRQLSLCSGDGYCASVAVVLLLFPDCGLGLHSTGCNVRNAIKRGEEAKREGRDERDAASTGFRNVTAAGKPKPNETVLKLSQV